MSRDIQNIFNGIALAPHQRPFRYTALGGETEIELPFTPYTGMLSINGQVKIPEDDYTINVRKITLTNPLSVGQKVYGVFDVKLSPEHTVGHGYKPFEYTATGGETIVPISFPVYSVRDLYIGGDHKIPNKEWSYNEKTNSLNLTMALTTGQVLYCETEVYTDYRDDRYRSISEVARAVNVKEEAVIFADDKATKLDGKTIIFDVSDRSAWKIPAGIPGNDTIINFSNGVLVYTSNSVVCPKYLPAQAGSNSDITRLNSLVGPLALGGDPVLPYDAATKRWVENLINSGSAGPTMNGVMNYGVGQATLWTTRAYIPPYALPMDGQLVNRADWPELWAHAQQHGAISDATWVADPLKRAMYSTGNGTTTFRLPDTNGVQKNGVNGFTGPDSLLSAFGRGDQGTAAGTMLKNAAPNILGNFDIRYGRTSAGGGAGIYLSGSGALAGTTLTTGANAEPMQFASQGTSNFQRISIDASRSHDSYGTAGEIRPNCFFGVWIVRASGGFVAANTSWSVRNADTALPAGGVNVSSGRIKGEYFAASKVYHEFSMDTTRAVGDDVSRVKLTASSYLSAGTLAQSADYYFGSHGISTFPGDIGTSGRISGVGFDIKGAQYPGYVYYPSGAGDSTVGGQTIFEVSASSGATPSVVALTRRLKNGSTTGQINISFPTTAGTLALQGTSGREFKKDIIDSDCQEAMERIMGQRMVTFVYKDDEQERVRFGIIAEEAEIIAPQYIKHNDEPIEDVLDEHGEKVGVITRDRPSVDGNPIIMDLLGAVQLLKKELDELKSEIAQLKS